MSKLKCPFCQQELVYLADNFYCSNCYSNKHKHYAASPELWQELIRTRKALNKAKWWLHEIVESHRYTPISTAEMALEQITALEQKDVK